MAWTWLLNLAPVADDIFKSIRNVVGSGKRAKALEEAISKSFTDLYKKSVSGLERDVNIISGWKPGVSGLQGVEAVVRSWEVIVSLAQSEKAPDLALKVITSKRVSNLKEQIESIEKFLAKIADEAEISWHEGGVDIQSSFDLMAADARQLRDVVGQFEVTTKDGGTLSPQDLFHIDYALQNIRSRSLVVMNYWDAFLHELATNAAAAPKVFQKGLASPVKTAIKSRYDDTKWADILNKIYNAVEAS